MAYSTIITTEELSREMHLPGWIIVDCRFSLQEPGRGKEEYCEAHIAGALYAHLEEDLSGEIIPGKTGRHPLPPASGFAETLSGWGVAEGSQVVAYDDASGAIAARLWWMLRWLGHDAVAVLDGGWRKWQREGRATRGGVEKGRYASFEARPREAWTVDAAEVTRAREDSHYLLLDARARERFEGEVEPIDVRAGHIPGAVNLPYSQNLDEGGEFRSPRELKQQYEEALGGRPPDQVICYCGSGVTAAHNLLAMAHAGMGMGKLYPGSWSEWIIDPERPIG